MIRPRRRSPLRIAINARFATIPVTGVQRYARELLGELTGAGAVDAVAIVPPGELVELDGRDWLMSRAPTDRWSGGRGHLWEQATLPGLVRHARADLLLSPCNWGPMVTRRQLPIFHDTAPLFHPEYFVPSYARWARIVTSRLVRNSVRSAATCTRVRDELVRFAGASPESVDVVPPGVGPPFTDYDIDPVLAPAPRCVFVGGHDVRKNLTFLTSFWEPVHAELGLALDVVGRSWTSTRRIDHPVDGEGASTPGVRFHVDVDDVALARLLAGALCLLWPSHYEGYGLPLLEAMAVGTPFLSSDTGAARELAISSDQVLPLHHDAWINQLRRWCEHQPAELRAASMARARAATWTRSSAALLEAIERAAHR